MALRTPVRLEGPCHFRRPRVTKSREFIFDTIIHFRVVQVEYYTLVIVIVQPSSIT